MKGNGYKVISTHLHCAAAGERQDRDRDEPVCEDPGLGLQLRHLQDVRMDDPKVGGPEVSLQQLAELDWEEQQRVANLYKAKFWK